MDRDLRARPCNSSPARNAEEPVAAAKRGSRQMKGVDDVSRFRASSFSCRKYFEPATLRVLRATEQNSEVVASQRLSGRRQTLAETFTKSAKSRCIVIPSHNKGAIARLSTAPDIQEGVLHRLKGQGRPGFPSCCYLADCI